MGDIVRGRFPNMDDWTEDERNNDGPYGELIVLPRLRPKTVTAVIEGTGQTITAEVIEDPQMQLNEGKE